MTNAVKTDTNPYPKMVLFYDNYHTNILALFFDILAICRALATNLWTPPTQINISTSSQTTSQLCKSITVSLVLCIYCCSFGQNVFYIREAVHLPLSLQTDSVDTSSLLETDPSGAEFSRPCNQSQLSYLLHLSAQSSLADEVEYLQLLAGAEV